MPERAEELLVRNLIDALDRLHDDLDRVELWTVALSSFQRDVPDYQSSGGHLLPQRQPVGAKRQGPP